MKKRILGILALVALFVAGAVYETVGAASAQNLSAAHNAVYNTFPAVSGSGSTPWIWVGNVVPTKHAVSIAVTGGATYTANLEGSIDGVNATTIVAASTTPGAVAWDAAVTAPAGGLKPVLWVRVTATLTGGTNPTFTASYVGSN